MAKPRIGLTCHRCEGPMAIGYHDSDNSCWVNPDSLAVHCKRRPAPNRFLSMVQCRDCQRAYQLEPGSAERHPRWCECGGREVLPDRFLLRLAMAVAFVVVLVLLLVHDARRW